MPLVRTPDTRARARCAIVLGALTLALVGSAAAAQAEPRPAVQARTLEFVDAASGQAIARVPQDTPFWVRYTLANDQPYPVTVTEVRSEIQAPSSCGVEDLPDRPRGPELPVVLPGGTTAWVGEDAATWIRTEECSAEVGWRAAVLAERVPSTTSLDVENHRFGEAARLEATVTSDWASQRGRVEFLVDGSPLGAAQVRDGTAVLAVTARTIAPGAHWVVARYGPVVDGPAGSSSEPVALQVSEAEQESVLTVRGSSQRHDEPGRLEAGVEPRGASGQVQFLVDGEPWGEAVTLGEDGAATATRPGDFAVGRHTLAATFTSSEADVAGSVAPAVPFDIGQVPARIEASLSRTRITQGDPVTVSGRVELGSDGARLPADSRVDVLDAYGGRIARATPAPTGQFRLTTTLPESAPEGRYPMFVSFGGTQTYGGAMVELTLQVSAPVEPVALGPSPAASPTPSPASSAASPSAVGSSPAPRAGSESSEDSLLPGAPSGAPLLAGLVLVLGGAVLTLRQVWRT